MITHKKKYGIYHWDTFDNETILVGEVDTAVEAIEFVNDKYGDRIRRTGADRVDIVDLKGNVLQKFSVG
jgi:hypothetical protein